MCPPDSHLTERSYYMRPSFDCIENLKKQRRIRNVKEENAQSKPVQSILFGTEDEQIPEICPESNLNSLKHISPAISDDQIHGSVTIGDVFDSLAPLFFLGMIAGLTFFAASMHLSIALDTTLIITSIFLTFGLYLINQYTDHKEDLINRTDNRFLFQKRRWPLFIAILFVTVSVFVLAATNRLVPWHMLLIIVGGVLYNFRIFPVPDPKQNWHLKGVKIKEMVLIKNIVVSLMWSCSAYIIIMQYKQISVFERPDCLVVIGCFFLSSMVNTMTSDIDDIRGDSAANIKTYATQYGLHGTYAFLFIITILALTALFFLSQSEQVGAAEVFYFLGCVLWVYIVTSPFMKKILRSQMLRDFLTDSEALVCAVGLILISIK